MPVYAIAALALAVNIPLGYLRHRARRFSAPWFVWVHLSIPLIATCRLLSGLGWTFVPLFITAAVIGQVLGGKIRPWPL